MEATVITHSDVSYTPKYAKKPSHTIDADNTGDTYYISLIEKGVRSGMVSREEAMGVLKANDNNAEEALEDIVLYRLIEEGLKDPALVSREEIMKVLEG